MKCCYRIIKKSAMNHDEFIHRRENAAIFDELIGIRTDGCAVDIDDHFIDTYRSHQPWNTVIPRLKGAPTAVLPSRHPLE